MENIQVALRIRPQNRKEIEAEDPALWRIKGNQVGIFSEDHMNLVRYRKIKPGQRTTFNFSKESLRKCLYSFWPIMSQI